MKITYEKAEFTFKHEDRIYMVQWEPFIGTYAYNVNIFRDGNYQLTYESNAQQNKSNSMDVLKKYLAVFGR